jgi:radical SAM-linked protein
MQRLRVKFSRGEQLKFISHLDITRLWQRAFIRADIPLSHSQGFNPHPQISLAAPLPVGVTGSAELMDIFCFKNVSPPFFTQAVNRELPEGIRILQTQQVNPELPSLQAQVNFAEYEVTVETKKSKEEIELAITHLLSLSELPWQHKRDTGIRHYDLRVLIDNIWLFEQRDGSMVVGMKLKTGSTGSGRPEQVTLALGFLDYPRSIHRTQLFLKTS